MEKKITLNQFIKRLSNFAGTYGDWDVTALGVGGVNDEFIHLINLERNDENGNRNAVNLGISYDPEDMLNRTYGIKTISLLSIDEYEKYKDIIPKINSCWLLKTNDGNSCFIRRADKKSEDYETYYYNCPLVGLRPALTLKSSLYDVITDEKENKISIKSKIKIGKYSFTILNTIDDYILALCDDVIVYKCFNPDTDKWDVAKIEGWLETEGISEIVKK